MKKENQERFKILSKIEKGWFNELKNEGEKVTEKALNTAKILTEIFEKIGDLFICITKDGGIQLEITLAEKKLEFNELIIGIHPDGDFD